MTSRIVTPLVAPTAATVVPPGSKSLTNRALLCAGLASGTSRIGGVLLADDTRAMLGAIAALGARVQLDEPARTATVTGLDPRQLTAGVAVDALQSGTTARFILPVLALASVACRLDGDAQLRARPFGPQAQALTALGVQVDFDDAAAGLPLTVTGPARGGSVELPGHVSSQFLSGLLMAGPLMRDGLHVSVTSDQVSVPYLALTRLVMAAFGCDTRADAYAVSPGRYAATDYHIEPDASAASYFWGAGAMTGGSVTVSGLGTSSQQGDVAFVDVLEEMGAAVERTGDSITVRDSGTLRGVDVDMADISDTAQTLAAVAVFADSPTRVRGIGFIRRKETDRIAAVVTELRRAGIDATEDDDGFTIYPGAARPTVFHTYGDHRMAMSLSLIGLRAPGIRIDGTECVAKTYPEFFDDLERLRA